MDTNSGYLSQTPADGPRWDRRLLGLGFVLPLLLVAALAGWVYSYSDRLPAQIATHFGSQGVDDFASPVSLTVMCAVLSPILLFTVIFAANTSYFTVTRTMMIYIGIVPWGIVVTLALATIVAQRHGAAAPGTPSSEVFASTGGLWAGLMVAVLVYCWLLRRMMLIVPAPPAPPLSNVNRLAPRTPPATVHATPALRYTLIGLTLFFVGFAVVSALTSMGLISAGVLALCAVLTAAATVITTTVTTTVTDDEVSIVLGRGALSVTMPVDLNSIVDASARKVMGFSRGIHTFGGQTTVYPCDGYCLSLTTTRGTVDVVVDPHDIRVAQAMADDVKARAQRRR